MDGVDLDIEVGSHKYYPDFVREIRRLMRTDTSKPYLITAAPQCPFPDAWMGPNTPGSALKGTHAPVSLVFQRHVPWAHGELLESSSKLKQKERKKVVKVQRISRVNTTAFTVTYACHLLFCPY